MGRIFGRKTKAPSPPKEASRSIRSSKPSWRLRDRSGREKSPSPEERPFPEERQRRRRDWRPEQTVATSRENPVGVTDFWEVTFSMSKEKVVSIKKLLRSSNDTLTSSNSSLRHLRPTCLASEDSWITFMNIME